MLNRLDQNPNPSPSPSPNPNPNPNLGRDFHDAWFQSSRIDLERAGLLTEYFKHTDLGAGCAISANPTLTLTPTPTPTPTPTLTRCAISATSALKKTRGAIGIEAIDELDKLETTDEKLTEFIQNSGAWPAEENGIKTVRSLSLTPTLTLTLILTLTLTRSAPCST